MQTGVTVCMISKMTPLAVSFNALYRPLLKPSLKSLMIMFFLVTEHVQFNCASTTNHFCRTASLTSRRPKKKETSFSQLTI